MTRRTLLPATVLGALALTAGPAFAQDGALCDARDSIVATLEAEYGERHNASGLQTAESMVELWVSEESGSWTILLTRPDGISCIAAAGENWLSAGSELQGVVH